MKDLRQRLRRTSPAGGALQGAALLFLLCLFAIPIGLAATRHVDVSSVCPGSGTEAAPYCLIQTAICNATAGDVIMVAPGTYAESLRMRPGVSVIAEGDYTNTTIDGAGKPCIGGESDPPNPGVDFCLPIVGSTQCSTVVFGSSFSNADRLDGFTIKNGKGIVRTEDGAISGGGIFVLSSPTISNNMITGNALEGPQRFYLGGGVYLNATVSASPVLTRNTIEGNRAVPQSGTYLAMNYGIGGGVYSGIHVHPTISSNVITSNRAGDVSIFLAGGYGGGIATGTHSGEPAILTSNLIAGNMASTDGAGLYIGYGLSATPIARVTNNEIRGNEAGRRGGALSVFYANAEIVNNTLVNNTAKNGGGLYVSRGEPGDLVLVSNNLITGNRATDTLKGGGAIYFSVEIPLAPATVRSNDFFGNIPSTKQMGGARKDLAVIGKDGNMKVDPKYVSSAANDFHLSLASPGIDKGNNSDAGAIETDADGRPRIQDSKTVCAAIVDLGAFESPAIDTDGDAVPNCTDVCVGDPLNDGDLDGLCGGAGFSSPKVGDHDNCPSVSNISQANADGDADGDACDICLNDAGNDQDGDGICAGAGFTAPKTADHDNCPAIANPSQADVDGDGIGDPCDVMLVAPPDLTVFSGAVLPQPFTWTAGGAGLYQVQFSTTADPFTPVLVSKKAFKPGTTYLPSRLFWKKIGALGANGVPVYWRVAGKADKKATAISTSEPVFSFTITP